VSHSNPPPAVSPIVLGLQANWRQFWLLVAINGFVGAMVGLERAILPLIAEQEFAVGSTATILGFVASFGLTKAVTNLLAGRWADRVGRKPLLVVGWLLGIPVPLLVIWAPSWEWIVGANILLGVNQGLTWSTTVLMKIDLVGPARRGLAMGLNEFAGYLAVAAATFGTGEIASRYGLRPEPLYLGVAIAAIGLALSVIWVRETREHARHEATRGPQPDPAVTAELRSARAGWRNPSLVALSQAGLVNNLNDAVAWGLFPLFFAAADLSIREIAILAAAYPAVWGIGQLGAGAWSDRVGRKPLIVAGMVLQGLALVGATVLLGFPGWILSSVALGVGTALVYPTLLAAVGDIAPPARRGAAVGWYRFWRDLGYPLGAVLAGITADRFGFAGTIAAVGAVTIGSGILVAIWLPETLAIRPR
jgi:MFS family permease